MNNERQNLIDEVRLISASDNERLTLHKQQLREEAANSPMTSAAVQLVNAAIGEVDRALQVWSLAEDYLSSAAVDDETAFGQIMAICGFAIRKSASAKAILTRHSPSLRGYPSGLDPSQSIRTALRDYTVDYLRGGYIMYQRPGETPPVQYADHPVLQAEATRLSRKLYPAQPDLTSLSFTSGIAALDTVMDVLAAYSIATGRINYIGKNSWIELRRRLNGRSPEHFQLYDDSDPTKAAELIAQPAVQSVLVEGIQNHPQMRVCDLAALRRAALTLQSESPKFLVIDNVATFDTDVFALLANPAEVKAKVCFVSAISGIKFLHNGADCAKSGLLTVRSSDEFSQFVSDVIEARAGSGRAPAFEELYACGVDTVQSLASRMKRYDRNTRLLAEELEAFCKHSGFAQVISPWLPSHPDHRRALELHGHGGRFVYIRLTAPDDANGEHTLALYRHLADQAAQERIPLVAASNFGFAIPHIHVVRHESIGISLRASLGSVNIDMAKRTVAHLTRGIDKIQSSRKIPSAMQCLCCRPQNPSATASNESPQYKRE